MKKLLITLGIFLAGLTTFAQTLTITNNTCGVVKITAFGHNNVYTNCMDLQARNPIIIFSGGTYATTTPFNIGSCWIVSSYPTTTPGTNFTLDGIKFEADDENGCIEYGAVGNCGGLPNSFTGSCQFCFGSVLNVTWTVIGANTSITFNL
jgi:hypothetical protein